MPLHRGRGARRRRGLGGGGASRGRACTGETAPFRLDKNAPRLRVVPRDVQGHRRPAGRGAPDLAAPQNGAPSGWQRATYHTRWWRGCGLQGSGAAGDAARRGRRAGTSAGTRDAGRRPCPRTGGRPRVARPHALRGPRASTGSAGGAGAGAPSRGRGAQGGEPFVIRTRPPRAAPRVRRSPQLGRRVWLLVHVSWPTPRQVGLSGRPGARRRRPRQDPQAICLQLHVSACHRHAAGRTRMQAMHPHREI
jgi:hypothetical protein